MAIIAPVDVLTFGVRMLFVALLYVVVASVLLTLRNALREASEAARQGATGGGDPPGPALAVLTVVTPAAGDVAGRATPLSQAATIGTLPTNEIVLRDEFVSKRHARVFPANGRWLVEDLGSTNGTLVNGRPIDSPVELRPGDTVSVGRSLLRFDDAA